MKVDLHIHSKDGSDGRWRVDEILAECAKRGIGVISITDHDSIDAQRRAMDLAASYGLKYITGVELNVTFSHPSYMGGKSISLDLLGYQFDISDKVLARKLEAMREFRRQRAAMILEKLNREFTKEGLPLLSEADLEAIEANVEGAIGRPHIAAYLIKKGIVANQQEAFDRFLVKCDIPKMPLSLQEASELIRSAGGKLMLAHPNDPNGISLIRFTSHIQEQMEIVRETMLEYIDGIECWHSRHDKETMAAYAAFAQAMGLMVSGGSDCHQDPVLMGEVAVPHGVAEYFLT